MNISHYQAFELFQKSIDGPLSAQERASLDQHLATCAECRADVALYRKLETQARARHPIVAVPRQDVQQTIHKTRAHFQKRRALKRLLNPLQTLAWVGATAALTVAVIWILVSHQVAQVDTSLELERRLVTATPGSAPTPTTPPYPTPMPTVIYGLYYPYYVTQKEALAEVDLNCDGVDERIVNTEAYSRDSFGNATYYFGTIGVALLSSHHEVWDYRCRHWTQYGPPVCTTIETTILATDSCEQFLTIFGSFKDRSSPRLIIFRWDGQNMSIVLDERAEDWKATQDPLVITTMLRDHCVTAPHRCDDEEINYVWNGTKFVRERRD